MIVSPAMLFTENMASKMSLEEKKKSWWAGNALEMTVKSPNWLKRLPPLIVVQVSKQYVLLHGFGQGSHALVVFWDDLGWKKACSGSSVNIHSAISLNQNQYCYNHTSQKAGLCVR